MSTANISSTSITVEHIRITCQRSFAEVRAALEANLPRLDPAITTMLTHGDQEGVIELQAHGPKLYLFLERDHGALLAIVGQQRNAVQYEIGNPITASTMTRHHLGAALYAPLRVSLLETASGEVVFEYDKPSDLFGQFGDERVTEVGRYLDRELQAVLVQASA